MRTMMVAMAGLVLLAGCGRSSEPVGENSAGSIRTTAVGTIVATEPSATPTPVANQAALLDANMGAVEADNATQ